MPYIAKDLREEIKTGVYIPSNPGQLNYQFTACIRNYIDANGGLSYQTINDVVGALEGCKLEFYRRIAVPYEETKITENGDVY